MTISIADVTEGKQRENSIYAHLSSTQPRSQKHHFKEL